MPALRPCFMPLQPKSLCLILLKPFLFIFPCPVCTPCIEKEPEIYNAPLCSTWMLWNIRGVLPWGSQDAMSCHRKPSDRASTDPEHPQEEAQHSLCSHRGNACTMKEARCLFLWSSSRGWLSHLLQKPFPKIIRLRQTPSMENFSPGCSRQTLLHTDGNGATGRFWLFGVRSCPCPCLLEMQDRKSGNNKTSHTKMRNCYQPWSDIGLVGFTLSVLPATSPADTQGLSKPHFPARGSRWQSQRGHFAKCPQSCWEGSVFPIPAGAWGRGFPPCHAVALWGKINLYELEQPLLEVTAPGPARELIPDLLFSKHPALLLFRYLESGLAAPNVLGSQTLCGKHVFPDAVWNTTDTSGTAFIPPQFHNFPLLRKCTPSDPESPPYSSILGDAARQGTISQLKEVLALIFAHPTGRFAALNPALSGQGSNKAHV